MNYLYEDSYIGLPQRDTFLHCDRIPTKVKLVSCHHLHHKIEEWLFKTKFFTTICAVLDNIVLADILEQRIFSSIQCIDIWKIKVKIWIFNKIFFFEFCISLHTAIQTNFCCIRCGKLYAKIKNCHNPKLPQNHLLNLT